MSSKTTQTATRRARAAAIQNETAKRERRNKIITWTAVGAAAIAIVAATGAGVYFGDKTESAAAPASVADTTYHLVGDVDAPVSVELYEDFQCPACNEFEKHAGPALNDLVESGDINIRYHMMSFLGDGSERAASAASCAADHGKFKEFHQAVMTNPTSGDFTNAQLITLGEAAGVTGEKFEKCVNDGTYTRFNDKVDTEAARNGITTTPTALVDGSEVPTSELLTHLDELLAD